MANSQHRCVFVGNIPYDASEEQLIQICEEVGPVVSFRLVVERETGKPKGYGFCEYKDEETALSARRNLQGYEINGRQLRVDFAENDKGADRNREQGRGGPGMTANADVQKQGKGLGDSSLQPIGLPLAMAAASVMAGTLGGGQTGIKSNQNGLQNQLGFGTDPLTLHLARMSKNQLTEIINDLKVMAAQNKELARKLLLSNPQLPKALFQAEIMIGIVPTQMFQMANIQQVSGSKLPIQDGQQVQQLSVQTIPGQSSLAQNNTLSGLMPKSQVGQIAAVPQSSLLPGQFPILPQATAHPQIQPPQLVSSQVLHQSGTLRGQSGVSTLPSIHSQPLANFSVRPQTHLANSSSLKQHMQPSLPPNSVQNVSVNLGYNNQPLVSNAVMQPSLVRPPLSERGFKPDRSTQIADDAAWVNFPEPINRPSKLVKLDDGRVNSISVGPTVPAVSGVSQAFGTGLMSANQTSPAEEVKHSEKQVPLLADVESALLQQVMSLTPEQLSSLPPEQQQQVIQLQQMLR